MIITITDYKSNKLNQKPYSSLYIGKGNKTAYVFIDLLINLNWLSVKYLDFMDWVIIFILVSEGKHYLSKGKYIIALVNSRMRLKRTLPYAISKEIMDLLQSESNYAKSDQTGIFGIKYNDVSNYSIKHIAGSYVLATNMENSEIIRFKSNAECAIYFEVSKVSIGRWILKNTPVLTKKGNFLFKKVYDE